jgi:hypothetical protein
VTSDEVAQVKDEDDFLALIELAIARRNEVGEHEDSNNQARKS